MIAIKKFIKKVFYYLFPQTSNTVQLREELLGITSDIQAEVQFIKDYIDKQDPEFLKALDKKYLPNFFKSCLGYDLNIDDPKTFNEKLQWLKIHNRKPEMTIMVDKYRVREYLQRRGYSKYLNKLYGVYKNTEEVKKDWKNLPSSFVLKVNHWCGGNVFVKDKSVYDFNELYILDSLLKKNYYYLFKCGEWPYKDIEPCIIAEEYLEDESGDLMDYKIFCFNGKGTYIQLQQKPEQCFYDMEWNKMEFFYDPINFAKSTKFYRKPLNFTEMIDLAEQLSKEYIFLRVDLYNIKGRIFVGELTFTPGSGTNIFVPEEWDLKLGELLYLK